MDGGSAMTYTEAAAVAVAVAVLLDLVILGTRVLTRTAFWVSYVIVVFFQLIVNGLLTGLKIVRYDPTQILGPRIAFAPVEDLLFGFSMITVTVSLWVWVGRRTPPDRAGRESRGAGRSR
jgi:lycopene cyclase domain-containing protein